MTYEEFVHAFCMMGLIQFQKLKKMYPAHTERFLRERKERV